MLAAIPSALVTEWQAFYLVEEEDRAEAEKEKPSGHS